MDIIYRLRLLGTIQVEKDGLPLRNFESRKALALLGYLARHDQPVSRSHLAGLFWGEKEEARGRRNLSRELSQLSAQLAGCFQADYYTVQFQPPASYWVDTRAFAELVKSSYGRQGEERENRADFSLAPLLAVPATPTTPEPHPEKLAEAVALYRGDFMADYYLDDCPEFETWLLREQEGWRRQVTDVLERLITYHARVDQADQAEFYARRWLALEPWRERVHRYLMTLLARNGERTAALAQYEICRRALAEELAVEPAAETVALYERIRAGKLGRSGEALRRGDLADIRSEDLSRGDFTPAPPPPRPRAQLIDSPLHNLPAQPVPLIGREAELAQIAEHLFDPACRLLTLVGPGGMGKTQLAVQASRQVAANLTGGQIKAGPGQPRFGHGVYFIPLVSLSSAEFLVPTIAGALNFSFYSGTNPTDQLLNYLREKNMLLVLDNFEHLLPSAQEGEIIGGVDLLADMLTQAPHIKLMVVSRERLNLQEEYLLPIEGLRIPPLSQSPAGPEWENYSAVQLFLQRAQAVQPGFTLSEAIRPCVFRICQLLEGIPLAIELAAAWVRLLSCREIAQEIENNLDFLTTSMRNVPERHRSLRAVFDSSWRLLSAEEKRVLRQLTVFRGGFQREAAQQVVGVSLPVLLALADKSLLYRTETGRYVRHALLWQFAAEKLKELPDEKEKVQDGHCHYYATLLQAKEGLLKGGKQREALAEIDAEIENVRLSWRWAIAHRKIIAIEQALESLFHFYDTHSWFEEGAEAFGQAATSLAQEAAREPGGEEATRSGRGGQEQGSRGAGEQGSKGAEQNPKSVIVLGKLLARQGWFTFQLGRHEPARALLQESLALLSNLNTLEARRESIFPFNYLGAVYRHLGEYEPAQQYLQKSLAICQEVGDQHGSSIALNILSQVAYLTGDYPEARQLGQESLRIKREIDDRRGITFSLNNLGQVACALGEYFQAKELFQESLAISTEIGDHRGIALCLTYLGDVVRTMGEYQGAKQLYQEGLAIFKEIGNQWGIIISRTKLGEVDCDLGEFQVGHSSFNEALKMAMNIQATSLVLDILGGIAVLWLKSEKPAWPQILEILAVALNHPASSRDNQDRAARLLVELESRLPAGTITTTQARSQARSLEVIVWEIVGEGKG